MARARTGVDRLTLDVLLSALEAPKLELSAAALQSFATDIRVRLLSSGFIKPEGYEAVAVSIDGHDDNPVALTWSGEHRSFGYFSSIAGWVTIRHEDIRRYSIEIYAVFSALMSELGSYRGSASIVVPDTLWDLGNLRLGGSSRQFPILFARRLHDPARLQAVRRGLLLRPCEGFRIVLTSTHPYGLRETLAQGAIVSIHDVLGEGGTVSPLAIKAHLAQVHVERRGEVLALEAGGRVVHLYGETFQFLKGVHQRAIINLLHNRYLAGERWVPSHEIVAELNLRDNARIRDYFKKHPAWNKLLIERNGMCGFCLDEA
jgi:hypothetical protein